MQESVSSDPSPPTAVCVLGMHRSGTSALAGLLSLLGVDLGRTLIPAGPDNPKGFWEHSQIVSWHMGLLDVLGSFSEDFLPLPELWESKPQVVPYRDFMLALIRAEFSGRSVWGFKDPRTCRTLALWHQMFTTLGMQGRFVLMLRNPSEVADSMGSRSGCPYNQALLIGLGHILEAERHTRGRDRVIVAYDRMVSNWRAEAVRMADTLKLQWPRSPEQAGPLASRLIDPSMRHHRTGEDGEAAALAAGADPTITRWAFAAHRALTPATTGAPIDERALDQISDEFRRAAPGYAGWRPRKLKAPTVASGNR